jgi:competence protein CoiA
MEFALVNGQRCPAQPDLAGSCPACGSRTIARCGTKVLWHWAHYRLKHCDPWWENETPWHRAWKGRFPEDWRELVHFDPKGEKHVADVKTPSGRVLEFQNSPMTSDELLAREDFYGDMLWIVNGAPFFDHFFVLGRLPSPEAAWTRDLVVARATVRTRGHTFWRHSENRDYHVGQLVEMHSLDEIQPQIDADYVGHHLYDWVRPRSVWFESRVPVYIDFGGDLLWNIQRYDEEGLLCVQATRKKALIDLHGGTYVETGEIVPSVKKPVRNGDVLDRGQGDILEHLVR